MNPITYEYQSNRLGWQHAWEVSRIVPGAGKVIFGHISHNFGRGVYWTPAPIAEPRGTEMVPASFVINMGKKLQRLLDHIDESGDPATFVFSPEE